MSLIADALKAAEREREKRRDEARTRRARSVLKEPAAPEPRRPATPGQRQVAASIGRGRGKGMEWDPKLVGAAALLTLAVLIAVVVVARGGDDPAPPTLAADDGGFPADVAPVEIDLSQAPPPATPPQSEPDVLAGALDEMQAPPSRPATGDPAFADPLSARAEPSASDEVAPLTADGDPSLAAGLLDVPPADSLLLERTPLLEGRGARTPRIRVTVDGAAPAAASAFERAADAQRAGNLAEARRLYGDAIRQNPDNPELYNNLGTVHRALGDLDAAREAFRHALGLSPRYATAWSNLGLVLQARGERGEARAAFEEAIRLDPTNAAARVNLAIQYQQLGLHGEARQLLEAAIAADPTLAEAHYALGQVLEAEADRAGAARAYARFLTTSNGRFPDLERQVRAHLLTLGAR